MWRRARGAASLAGVASSCIAMACAAAAESATRAPQSANVAIVGSPQFANGGTLPTTGPPAGLAAFTFTELAPANVSASTVAAYDTVVLNLASRAAGPSPGPGCATLTLTASARAPRRRPHGRAGAGLLDPLGSARSHGCIRIDNADVRWLARHLAGGTPVHVTAR